MVILKEPDGKVHDKGFFCSVGPRERLVAPREDPQDLEWELQT